MIDSGLQTLGRSIGPHIRINALRVQQRADVPLFVFGVNGRLLRQFASIDFAERDKSGKLTGYQRDRVARHIREIAAYLRRDDAMLPNAIVVAFDRSTTFTPLDNELNAEWGTLGRLTIPLPRRGQPKSALVVDGQQRMSALAELPPTKNFPVVVVGFSTASADLQREQFVLVNKTRPLPRDLLNELLSQVETTLPAQWNMRRSASQVVEILRFSKKSPFYGRIRGIGSTSDGASISQAAVLDAIEGSIRRGGVLSAHFSAQDQTADVAEMATVMTVFFSGVARVWPAAWEGNPWTSRLVHGVGISALGRLMDEIVPEVNLGSDRALASVERRLRRLEGRCAWTSGRWPILRCAWNELQNTGQDKRRLAEYLLAEYRKRSRPSR